ncbi:unnamed protein product [Acanthoscelides obtectus]|uniref:Uncharacterized protein n=1 Tax=Acanthoscelides obtectus TaxID=200917 RepID=A0A9P0M6E2_ACAOB|nr:unnamed protein product [Acanthoscelides obtectus]CAK1672194.1 hypothetical protein AOBTE_LOCUS28710 [Acanthoscelides obtectus]
MPQVDPEIVRGKENKELANINLDTVSLLDQKKILKCSNSSKNSRKVEKVSVSKTDI